MADAKPKSSLSEFSELKQRYILWLATPKKYRVPKTQRAFAEATGTSEVVLSRYKREDPDLRREVHRQRLRRLEGKMADVYEAIAEKAVAGDMTAAKLAHQIYSEAFEAEFGQGAGDAEAQADAKKRSAEELADALYQRLRRADQEGVLPSKEAFVGAMLPGAGQAQA